MAINRGGKFYELVMAVPQSELTTLERWQKAVGGLGKIVGPYTREVNGKEHRPRYVLRFQGHTQVQAALAMIWNWLSQPKRDQAAEKILLAIPDYKRRFAKGTKGPAKLSKNQADNLRERHRLAKLGRQRVPQGWVEAESERFQVSKNTINCIVGGRGYA